MDRLRVLLTIFIVYLISAAFLQSKDSIETIFSEKLKIQLPCSNESSSVDLSQLPSRVSSSEWITFFPNLQKMVSVFIAMQTMPSLNLTTSPKSSIVTPLRSTRYPLRVGGIASATIQARDYKNQAKRYGGDFFRAVLYRDLRTISGVSCQIADLGNGNYTVNCPLLWEGQATLRVWLIHPSESLISLILMTSGEREIGVTLKSTVNNSVTRRQELVQCGFDLRDIASPSQTCDHTDPESGDPWFCKKTTSGECPPIEWMDRYYWDPMYFQVLGRRPLFKAKKNWRVSLSSPSPAKIVGELEGSRKQTQLANRSPCKTESFQPIPPDPASPSGWAKSIFTWSSSLCKNNDFSTTRLKLCLRNYVVYLLGDSTVRQWYRFLVLYLNGEDQGTDGPDIWAQARNGYVVESNTTIYYRAHGPPLHNPGTPTMRPYITNTLLNIRNNSRNTVVVFTIGLHMDLFHPDLYLQRIRRIRRQVLYLRIRAPDVQVFVKGHHVHAQTTRLCPSDWLSYRHDTLLRKTFSDIPGVVFLPYWDMTSVYNNIPYHPIESMLRVQIGLFQSVLCGTDPPK